MYQHRRFVRLLVLLFMTVQCLLVPAGHAGMISTDEMLGREARADHMASIDRLLQRQEAANAMARFGVAPEQVEQRLDRLTDAELARLAERADELPAGGVVGTLVVILLLLIVLDLLGATDIFPAIKPAN